MVKITEHSQLCFQAVTLSCSVHGHAPHLFSQEFCWCKNISPLQTSPICSLNNVKKLFHEGLTQYSNQSTRIPLRFISPQMELFLLLPSKSLKATCLIGSSQHPALPQQPPHFSKYFHKSSKSVPKLLFLPKILHRTVCPWRNVWAINS